jgi:hypothetical protein
MRGGNRHRRGDPGGVMCGSWGVGVAYILSAVIESTQLCKQNATTMATEIPRRVFKLTTESESATFQAEKTICSGLDAADGFIHLSDRTSAPVVAKLFFTEATVSYICMQSALWVSRRSR